MLQLGDSSDESEYHRSGEYSAAERCCMRAGGRSGRQSELLEEAVVLRALKQS